MALYRIPHLGTFSFQHAVKGIQNAPPGTPAKGDRYICGDSPTGAWAGYAWNVATYDGSSWIFDLPAEGWIAYSEATNDLKIYDGSAWANYALTESGLSLSDVTTGDVSTSKHGFAPKAPNDTSKFLRGDGSWAAPAAGGGLGYALAVFTTNITSVADLATLYFGNYAFTAQTTPDTCRVYIPKAGTIKAAEINVWSTTVGSNENVSLYIRLNNTTDTLIQTRGMGAANALFSNTGLSIAVSAGDYIEIKMVCPTFATNPAQFRFGGSIYIE